MIRRLSSFVCALVLLGLSGAQGAAAQGADIRAQIDTTLPRAGGQARGLAFDGSLLTFFESAVPPRTSDHFTLTLERPARVNAITVFTGRGDGTNVLEDGILEVSSDGHEFHAVGKVRGVVGRAELLGSEPIRAIRLRADTDQSHPLAIREITIEGTTAFGV